MEVDDESDETDEDDDFIGGDDDFIEEEKESADKAPEESLLVVNDSYQIRLYVTFDDVNKAEDGKKVANYLKKDYGWIVLGHPKDARVLSCAVGFTSHVIPTILDQLDPEKVKGPVRLKVMHSTPQHTAAQHTICHR